MSHADSFWQDRRVFVTGATGLVGSWTVRALLGRGAHRDHLAAGPGRAAA